LVNARAATVTAWQSKNGFDVHLFRSAHATTYDYCLEIYKASERLLYGLWLRTGTKLRSLLWVGSDVVAMYPEGKERTLTTNGRPVCVAWALVSRRL